MKSDTTPIALSVNPLDDESAIVSDDAGSYSDG